MSGTEAVSIFIGGVLVLFGVAVAALALVGRPRADSEGVTFVGGARYPGFWASSPFASLRITTEEICLEPSPAGRRFRRVLFEGWPQVVVPRAEPIRVSTRWIVLGSEVRIETATSTARFFTIPARPVVDAMRDLGWSTTDDVHDGTGRAAQGVRGVFTPWFLLPAVPILLAQIVAMVPSVRDLDAPWTVIVVTLFVLSSVVAMLGARRASRRTAEAARAARSASS